MSSVDLDLDVQLSQLEAEWRQAYEASIVARSDYQALAQRPTARCEQIDAARERLERAEARKANIMAKIERLEDRILSRE